MRTRINVFALYAALSCPFMKAAPQPAKGPAAHVSYSGQYVNRHYGFSVRIPNGFTAEGAAPGAPNHGFLIHFSDIHDDYLGVDASYVVAEESTEPSEDRGVIRREHVQIAGLSGTRTLSKTTTEEGEELLLDVVTFTRESSDPPIVYTISVRTTPALYEARSKILTEVLKSFQLLQVK